MLICWFRRLREEDLTDPLFWKKEMRKHEKHAYWITPRRGKKGDYYFTVDSSRNGQCIMTSEMYASKQSMMRTLNKFSDRMKSSKVRPLEDAS